jgi:peroxiredoxin Q/BCP
VILGASPDTVKKQAKFREKYDLPFTLLADVDHAIAEAYGVWKLKKFMGREYMGVERSTVLIDPSGRVARAFEKVSAADHPAEVAEAIEELAGRG